jgi:multiple sugar transport system permease protein
MRPSARSAASAQPRRRSRLEREVRAAIVGYSFLGLPLLGYVAFTILPVLGAFYLGLLRWDLLTEPRFIGLDNFVRLASDAKFWNALRNTALFCLGSVPLAIGGGLALALLMNHHLPGIKVFRGIYYVPYITSWVAVALVWSWLFDRDYGLLNFGLHFLGISGPSWLHDPTWALPSVIVVFAWKWMGFYALILLAGLQSIPRSLYEAAAIDGAGPWARFRNITLPLLSPATFFVIVTALINALNVFDPIVVMTQGGPNDTTQTVVKYIVDNAFQFFQIGYASAIAAVTFVLVLALTLGQNWLQRVWVHYE